MTREKVAYSCITIGPGGRKCHCCAPPSRVLKRMEHRAARRQEHRVIRAELRAEAMPTMDSAL